MALFLVTAPTEEPIALDEAKLHLKVDATSEDALIDALIIAAREYVETFTHRALLPQTWDYKLDSFPCTSDGEIWLPKPPVTSVTSITYLDTAGASQTWASTNYLTDLPTGPKARKARITPAYAVIYPATYNVLNAVTARFVCGYTNTTALTAVPESLKAAMKLMIGHWYAFREPVAVPPGVDALLWPFKAF